MSSIWTVRQVWDRVVELGLGEPGAGPEQLDETLDYYGEPDHVALLWLLDDLGIVYVVDYKAFRGVQDDGLAVYEEQLSEIASCSRGLLTITDVELVDAGSGRLLRFRCNGQQRQWSLGSRAHEEMEAQLTFATSLGELVPTDSPARWCSAEPGDPDEGPQFVFGDPDALRQLGEPFGLTLEPV